MKPQTKKILKLSIPAALNALLDMLQVIVDLIMVGRISAASIAAVGISLQIIGFLYAALTVFYVGTNSLISRLFGAGKHKELSVAVYSLLIFAFVLSLPVIFIWYFTADYILILMGASDIVVELGSGYLQILAIAIPAFFVKYVLVSALNGIGDTKTPFKIKMVSIVLNVILNYILIFGHLGFPALGVDGAAISTVIVNIFEALVYIFILFKTSKFRNKIFFFNKKLIKKAMKIGVPAGFERMLTFFSFLLFTAIITNFGTSALAGYQIGLRIEGLAFMPGIGFTIAAMTLMGQNIGAKNYEAAYSEVLQTTKIAAYFMGFLGIFMVLIPEVMVTVFTNDTDTIKEASLYLRIVGLSQVPLAFAFVLSGSLRGAGDTKTTLKINLISLWCFRIIPAFLVAYFFESILLVYIVMITETYIKAFWLWRAFKSGKWKSIRV